jgi:hypothetical protein
MDEDEKEERSSYREFIVTPGIVGFKVRIGCSEAYFGNKDDLRQAICNYLNDPQTEEKRYRRNAHVLGNQPGQTLERPDGNAEWLEAQKERVTAQKEGVND